MPQFRHGVYGVTSETGIRPVTISPTGIITIVGTAPDADDAIYPLNTPSLIAGSPLKAAKLDLTGNREGTLLPAVELILAQAGSMIVVIRVAEGVNDAETLTNVIGSTESDGTRRGMEVIYDVQSLIGHKPSILIVPGFSHEQPVVTKLQTITERLRSFAFYDCLGTTEAEANIFRQNFASKRLEACWPNVININSEVVPTSALAAGLRAKIDNISGKEYSASISNVLVNDVLGTEYTIDFTDGDASCLAYLLNSNQISTVINDGGLRYWGNLTNSSDTKWQFQTHVRVNDIILDAITNALKWARDRKLNKTFVEDVVETVNNFLAKETRSKNLLGGSAWADPEMNSADVILAGEFYLDYDFTPPGIAQAINVTSHFVNDYASAIFE